MLENEVFNRPYVRDITKTCECTCSVTCNPDIITNADRIRSMSDEELAIWLAEWSFCADACPASTNEVEETIGYCCPSNCKEQALTWLRQPAEEGKL